MTRRASRGYTYGKELLEDIEERELEGEERAIIPGTPLKTLNRVTKPRSTCAMGAA